MTTVQIFTIVFGIINSVAILAIILITVRGWDNVRKHLNGVTDYLKFTNQRISLTQMMHVERLFRDALREERYEDARRLKCVIEMLDKDLREMEGQPDEIDKLVDEAMYELIERFAKERKGGKE